MQRYCKPSYDPSDLGGKSKCFPYLEGGITCICKEDFCNGEQMDAIASRDSDSPGRTDASSDSDSPVANTTDIAQASSDDSSKSADPEMIVLLIGVVITFML